MLADLLADLADMAAATAWMGDGLCSGADPESWFPERGAPAGPAKRICHACPARAACLAYALDEEIPFGIFGGLTARERRRLLPLDLVA